MISMENPSQVKMSQFGERLKKILKERGMTYLDLAELTGLHAGTIAQYAGGFRSEPKLEALQKICSALEISLDYFADIDRGNLIEIDRTDFEYVPLVGQVSAGIPIEAIEQEEEPVAIPAPLLQGKGKCIALKVVGDSMEPRICDGDIVVVSESSCSSGDTVVVRIQPDNDATLKKFFRDNDLVTLVSDNKKYPPMLFSCDQFKGVEVVGKVIYLVTDRI